MLQSPLHEVKDASVGKTILRGLPINKPCDDYLMIIDDISQGVMRISKDYPDAGSAKNAPKDIYYEDQGGSLHFKLSSHSDTVVTWTKA